MSSQAIKRLYLVTVSSDHLVWAPSAAEAQDYLLSLPMGLVEQGDWYGTTKLSRHEPTPDERRTIAKQIDLDACDLKDQAAYDLADLEGCVAYDVAGMYAHAPILVTDDADVDLDLTVERAIDLDRLAHSLSLT
jgi:hypothetical protein